MKVKILLNDFYKILDIEEDIFEDVRGESETLAGLILELTGEIPRARTDSSVWEISVQDQLCRQEKDKGDLC